MYALMVLGNRPIPLPHSRHLPRCVSLGRFQLGGVGIHALGGTAHRPAARHTNALSRATKELVLLAGERQRCLAYLTHQEAAICAALGRLRQHMAALQQPHGAAGSDVPPCTSFAAQQQSVSFAERQGELR